MGHWIARNDAELTDPAPRFIDLDPARLIGNPIGTPRMEPARDFQIAVRAQVLIVALAHIFAKQALGTLLNGLAFALSRSACCRHDPEVPVRQPETHHHQQDTEEERYHEQRGLCPCDEVVNSDLPPVSEPVTEPFTCL